MRTITQIAIAALIFCLVQEVSWLRQDYERVHELLRTPSGLVIKQ